MGGFFCARFKWAKVYKLLHPTLIGTVFRTYLNHIILFDE